MEDHMKDFICREKAVLSDIHETAAVSLRQQEQHITSTFIKPAASLPVGVKIATTCVH